MTTVLAALTLDELAARWLPMLLDATLKGTAVLLLAGAALLAGRRASAATRQLVLLLGLASLLIMPVVSAALPGWRVLPGWARLDPPAPVAAPDVPAAAPEVPAAPAAPVEVIQPARDKPAAARQSEFVAPEFSPPAIAPATTVPPAPAPPSVAVAPTPAPAAPAVPQQPSLLARIMPWAMLAWAGGVIVFLVPLIAGRIGIWRLRRVSHRLSSGPLIDLLARARSRIGLDRPVTLLISPRRPMPMMWGIFRPTLLLPAESAKWSTDRQLAVLLHELGHVRRHDMLTKLLANLACAVYWFNPLAWLAFRRFQTEAERACDDLVLSAGSTPDDYAQHLLEIASGLQSGALAGYGSIAMARKSKLEGRLLAILDGRRNRRSLTRWGLLAAAILVSAIVVPLACMTSGSTSGRPDARPSAATQPAASPATQAVNSWPPKVEEGWLTGLWMMRRTDKPGPGEPNILMILLNPDKTAATLSVWGEPEKPDKVQVDISGKKWELQGNGTVNPSIILDQKSVLGGQGQPLTHLTGSTLTFYGWVNNFYFVYEYERCGPAVQDAIAKALAGSGVTVGTMPAAPTADWPPKPDTKLMAGTWVAAQQFGIKEFFFLTIQAGGGWSLGRFYGSPDDPQRISIDQQGLDWRLTEQMGKTVSAYFHQLPLPNGGDASWFGDVQRLTPDEMTLAPRTYHRASPELAARLAAATQPATSAPSAPLPADADKAKLINWVEDFFTKNYREITARQTIEWGQPEKLANGNLSIRYKYEATIWGKDKLIIEQRFTFTPEGKYVSAETLEKSPASGPTTQTTSGTSAPKELTFPSDWDTETLRKNLKKGLQRLAEENLPGYEVQDSPGMLYTILWQTKKVEVTRLAGKRVDSPTYKAIEDVPADDGLIVGMDVYRDLPQQLTTYEIPLPRLKAYLLINVKFGPKVDPKLRAMFSSPQLWLDAAQSATRPGTEEDKAKLINWVEDFFTKNYRDITARKLIEWGPPEKLANGNLSIRYKYEATIWGKDKLIIEQRFTFTPDGKYVSAETLEKSPASGPATAPATRPAEKE